MTSILVVHERRFDCGFFTALPPAVINRLLKIPGGLA
jgi:hypothetical protein